MEEQLISYEIAVLAKSKGFDIWQNSFYNSNEIETFDYNFDGSTPFATKEYDNENTIYAPTQSLLQKWLREIHNIIVSISHQITGIEDNPIFKYTNNTDLGIRNNIWYDTYEDALEAGLVEGLKLIEI